MNNKEEKKTTKKKNNANSAKSSSKKTTSKKTVKTSSKAVKAEKVTKVTPKEEVEKVEVEKVENKIEKTSKQSKHSLFKALAILIAVAVVLTWIIPSGYFTDAEFTKSTMTRTGIAELFLSMFYSVNYYLLQIAFVLMTGIFYGVLSKTKGYKTLVDKLTMFWTGKEKLFVLFNTLAIALYASISSQVFAILVFVPLIITIAYRLGFSKTNSLAITFGAMIAGLVGQTYSTYGMEYIINYMGVELTTGIAMRFGILAIAYILLNCLVFLTNKKSNNRDELVASDVFAPTAKEDGNPIGYAIIFVLLLALIILGFFPWSSAWEITTFDTFNTWLTTEAVIKIKGTEYPVFGYILGNVEAFGSWDIYTLGYIMLIILIFVKLFAKVKFDDALDYAFDGMKKMAKPALYIMLAYAMFVICYWSGFTAWIVDFFNSFGSNVTDEVTTYSFNPLTNALGNGIASIFHVDFGYTCYALSAMYAARFAENTSIIVTIMTSMNGLVSFFAPTSVLLVTGLSLYDISYKDWMKYIWKFVLGLFVILLIVFALMTYM